MSRMDYAKLRRTEQARDAIRDLRETERLQRQLERDLQIKALPQLSTDEIRRRLSWIKASDQQARYARRSIGMLNIARNAQLSLQYLYMIVNGDRVPTAKAAAKLSAALQGVNIATTS